MGLLLQRLYQLASDRTVNLFPKPHPKLEIRRRNLHSFRLRLSTCACEGNNATTRQEKPFLTGYRKLLILYCRFFSRSYPYWNRNDIILIDTREKDSWKKRWVAAHRFCNARIFSLRNKIILFIADITKLIQHTHSHQHSHTHTDEVRR